MVTEQETAIEVTETQEGNLGFKGQELELAKKHGFIKEEKPNADTKQPEPKTTEDISQKEEKEKPEEVKVAPEAPEDMSDEQEKEQFGKWNKNEIGLYIKAKKARARMKAAEVERDYLKTRSNYIEHELEKIKSKKKEEPINTPQLDEFGDPIKKEEPIVEDNKPLTLKDLKDWEEKKQQEHSEKLEKQKLINAKLESYEIESKEIHEDFDKTIELATDIFKNYKNLFKDQQKIQEVEVKIKNWVMESANMLNTNSKNIGELAYEIGKLHPKYKEVTPKDSEVLSEEKIEKILKPKIRTSASISGSGGTPATELTLEQAANMTSQEYSRLPKETREKLLRMSCGKT